jgi:hypothetical protein
MVDRWCDESVDVIRHDDEAVELKASGVAVSEECCDDMVGVAIRLKNTAALVGDDRQGVGL